MPHSTPRLRSLAALSLLAAITVGIPALLIAIAGWPLPRQLPDWDRLRIAIQQGDIPAEVVINTLAVIVWIAWAQLVWALGWELAVNLPRAQTGEQSRPAPLVPAAIAGGIGRLVAVLFTVGLTVSTTPTPTLAQHTVPAALVETPTAPAAALAAGPSPRAASACWQVGEQDNLWDIAERALGDGARAPEILELNPAMRSARDLRAGQLLRLPDSAVIAAGHQAPPSSTPDLVPPGPAVELHGYLAETIVTIQTGDTLWDLSEDRLLTASGQPVRPAATVAYLDQVIAANPDTIEDPNLIYAGEQFHFPAIGTPPPPEPAPPPPAEPSPATGAEPPQTTDAMPVPTTTPPPAPTAPAMLAAVPSATMSPVGSRAALVPPTTVPATRSAVTPHAQDESPAPWIAGLAGATVLASGLVLAYRRTRNRAAVAGASNLRAVSSDARGRQIEGALTTASNLPLVRWANHELAALTTRLNPRRIASATPVAVEISETRGMELLWTSPMPSAPAPWEATDGGWAWRILYDPDLPVPAEPEPAVLPGLVTIGQRDGGSVLVDLEALGSLAVTGDPMAAENLARSMLVELAAGDELANSYVHAVGIDLEGHPHLDRAQARDETSALELLQSIGGDHDVLLERHGLATTFQLRLGGTTGRELTVVAARAGAVDDLDRLIASAPPHRGVAVVIVGVTATARATLEVDADGLACLRPLGLHLIANQLPAAEAAGIAEMLREAAVPQPHSEPRAETRVTAESPGHCAAGSSSIPPGPDGRGHLTDTEPVGDQPHPEVIVRILGVPGVNGHPSLGRIDLNLITFLTCSGGTATESQVIDAVWNGRAIERTTLWNRISRARAALGGYIPPRDQGTNLVRIAPSVTTDAELLRHAVEQAQHLSSAQAVDHLRAAMHLVTGVPFDAIGYDWAHEQQHYADACQLIERAALMLVDLALDLDDVTTAKDAASIGLKALRLNEPLYRARMRIEAHGGNRAGIRHTYDELVSLLAELDDGTAPYSPTHATTALLEELLQEHRRTA